jgi:cell division protein FtsZ
MKGAKGVIISITGGEDMRLMEVDEAANHIKELVDPDANIIWGSAFNNDLEGKIRVSVVATGIDAEIQAPAAPAKVFAFPTSSRGVETPKSAPAPAPVQAAPAPVQKAEPAPVAQVPAAPAPTPKIAPKAPGTLDLGVVSFDDTAEETELLLGGNMLAPEPKPAPIAPQGTRSWIEPEQAAAPAARPAGGTLFERMSNIARGAAKANVEEEQPTLRTGRESGVEMPRFLNRQNNQ